MTNPKPHPAVAAAHEKGQFNRCDCGYLHWWPGELGPYNAYALQAIAAELNRLNREWDAQVRAES